MAGETEKEELLELITVGLQITQHRIMKTKEELAELKKAVEELDNRIIKMKVEFANGFAQLKAEFANDFAQCRAALDDSIAKHEAEFAQWKAEFDDSIAQWKAERDDRTAQWKAERDDRTAKREAEFAQWKAEREAEFAQWKAEREAEFAQWKAERDDSIAQWKVEHKDLIAETKASVEAQSQNLIAESNARIEAFILQEDERAKNAIAECDAKNLAIEEAYKKQIAAKIEKKEGDLESKQKKAAFEKIKSLIGEESQNASTGIINMNKFLNGHKSDIDNFRYEKLLNGLRACARERTFGFFSFFSSLRRKEWVNELYVALNNFNDDPNNLKNLLADLDIVKEIKNSKKSTSSQNVYSIIKT